MISTLPSPTVRRRRNPLTVAEVSLALQGISWPAREALRTSRIHLHVGHDVFRNLPLVFRGGIGIYAEDGEFELADVISVWMRKTMVAYFEQEMIPGFIVAFEKARLGYRGQISS